jgi:histidinol dehydrogenase
MNQQSKFRLKIIEAGDPALERIFDRNTGELELLKDRVAQILAAVREKGDEAVCDFSARFNGVRFTPAGLKVTAAEIRNAYKETDEGFLDALHLALRNITAFHRRQLQHSWFESDESGSILGQLIRPLRRVGLYVPGGKASYPSSVLMNAIPARVAGVKEVVMVTPPASDGSVSAHVLVAAAEAGVHEIYKIGGAQAIAALAFGTSTVPRVDKITGPGNIYVALAKQQVYGQVDIDMIAGPSEILIIADETAAPAFIAADLLSQAEHDEMAAPVLLTPSRQLAFRVQEEVAAQSALLLRKEIVEHSLDNYGAIVLTGSIDEAFDLANRFAPEHLELMLEEPLRWLARVENAGAVFVGAHSPEPVGDYLAGPNHILPTGGTARFYSPLGVDSFLKKSSLIAYTGATLAKMGDAVIKMAGVEGLEAHANAVRVRLKKNDQKKGIEGRYRMNTLFDAAKLAREDLQNLNPYEAPFYPDLIKLDANENSYEFPPEVRAKITAELETLNLNCYPDAMAQKLRESIAGYTGTGLENIMVGNGSDELILNIILTFAAGERFVVTTPTFVMYQIHGRVAAAEVVEVPRLDDFSIDVSSIKRVACGTGIKLVFICTPNNPTGNAVPREEIEEVLRGTNAIVVVDEAYGEFGGESCVPLLSRYPNLIVLRTFSKAFGMAGLRVGYLLSGRSVIKELLKVKQPFNLNTFSQVAARLVLENQAPFKERIEQILKERDRLFKELSSLRGVEVFPSQANFILFRTSLPAEEVYFGLLERGVLIRNISSPALSRCLRVTVGTPEENDVFMEKMSEILNL